MTVASVLVDSSVLLDVATSDPEWSDWSARQLWRARETTDVVINALVYAEVSAAFDRIETADMFFQNVDVRREDVPWGAAFAAGQMFKSSRKTGGARNAPLPDFFIAAHAMICGYALLSRDRGFLRQPYAALKLIHPDTHP